MEMKVSCENCKHQQKITLNCSVLLLIGMFQVSMYGYSSQGKAQLHYRFQPTLNAPENYSMMVTVLTFSLTVVGMVTKLR